MGYFLIVIAILICCLLIFVFAKVIHIFMKKKVNLLSTYLILMTLVLFPLLTVLIHDEISNYWSSPTVEDSRRLGEMVAKTIHSPEYKKIARNETIYAIEPVMSRYNRPKDSYLYDVYVSTDKEIYTFSCDEIAWAKTPKCEKVKITGTGGNDNDIFFKGYKVFKNGEVQ